MRKSIIPLLLFLFAFELSAQLSIEECYEKARLNYPQIKQQELIRLSSEYSLHAVSTGYLPQLSLSGKASWQSEVVGIPLSIPGIEIPKINKDQYQLVAEVNQLLWDGGANSYKRQQVKAEHDVEQQQYEVDLYALNERINDLFFGILLLKEQLALTDLYIDELTVNDKRLRGAMANGVANRSDLDVIQVEILKVSQQRTEWESMLGSYTSMLAYFIGEPVVAEKLVQPDVENELYTTLLTSSGTHAWHARPELSLFEAGMRQLDIQKKGIAAANRPVFNLFLQGGYGNPGLNMLKEGFRPYALGGIRFVWNFGSLYSRQSDLRKIDNGIDQIRVRQDIFNFNMQMKVAQQQNEMSKYEKILRDDEEIVRLRENIKKASEAKLENGTATVSDLVRDITAEQTARRNKAIHEVEMVRSVYQLKNTLNK